MFHLPSCSKLLKKPSQLPIGLPAQSVRLAVSPASLHFSRLPHPPRAIKTQLPPPCYICKMSTVSARSRRPYGKIEDYEQFIGIRLHAAVYLDPDVSLPPSFPYPSPPRTQDPVQSSQPWWRLVKAAITQLKKYWAKSVDEFSPRKRRKHAKNEETNIWHYHGQYFAGKKVFNTSRGSCSRFTYALFVQRVKVFSIPFLPSRACFEKTEKC